MRVAIAAGGTTGHLSPGLAVAEVLRELGAEVLFIGTPRGPESRIVSESGFAFAKVKVISRGRGGVTWRNVRAMFRLGLATLRCSIVFLRFRPQVVLGMGGYVSLPAAFAATLVRCPLVLHEQNSVPGFANRLSARFAKHVAVSFPGTEGHFARAIFTGNPVRAGILNAARRVHADPDSLDVQRESYGHFGLDSTTKTLLVTGGSQGALRINTLAFGAFELLKDKQLQVLHLVGEAKLAEATSTIETMNSPERIVWKIVGYTDRMDLAYACADLCLSRAGASTISELATWGLPAILVPLPNALDDDQRRNAEIVAGIGGAMMILDADLTPDVLAAAVEKTLFNDALLDTMGEAFRSFAKPNAAEEVARIVMQAPTK